jgi:hypothetical protein
MVILLFPIFLLSVIVGMVLTSSRRRGNQGADDEFAYAVAYLRREKNDTERRREPREEVMRTCTASLLGQEETRTACRVLNVSRSGMRMAARVEFAQDAQVIVEWDSEFFVGTVCYGIPKDGEHILGLRLVSTNCVRG